MKVLVDSSTLIALVKIGELDFLREHYSRIYITEEIKREVTDGNRPENIRLEKIVGDWIDVVQDPVCDDYSGLSGLDQGEKSILNFAAENDDVLLLLDETEARAVARAEGFDFTGTLGLIVYLNEREVISKDKARKVVKKLANSDFRMTVELYDWALDKIC